MPLELIVKNNFKHNMSIPSATYNIIVKINGIEDPTPIRIDEHSNPITLVKGESADISVEFSTGLPAHKNHFVIAFKHDFFQYIKFHPNGDPIISGPHPVPVNISNIKNLEGFKNGNTKDSKFVLTIMGADPQDDTPENYAPPIDPNIIIGDDCE